MLLLNRNNKIILIGIIKTKNIPHRYRYYNTIVFKKAIWLYNNRFLFKDKNLAR